VEHRHRVQVEGVARARLERADAALTEDHVVVALAHDVLGCHEELVDGAGHAALQEDWRLSLANLLEQREVLGIPRADLHDVDLLVEEDLDVTCVHDFGNDRHAELGARLAEEVEAFYPHALVGVRARTRLVGSASKHRCPCGLHASGDADEVLALHRAGAGDYLEVSAADLYAKAAVHYGVGGMELAIRLLERLGDALHALHDVHALEQEGVDLGGIAHEADDELIGSLAHMSLQALLFNPTDEVAHSALVGILLEDGNHVVSWLCRGCASFGAG